MKKNYTKKQLCKQWNKKQNNPRSISRNQYNITLLVHSIDKFIYLPFDLLSELNPRIK